MCGINKIPCVKDYKEKITMYWSYNVVKCGMSDIMRIGRISTYLFKCQVNIENNLVILQSNHESDKIRGTFGICMYDIL